MFYCSVQYAYKKQGNTKNYYSFNVSSSSVSSVVTAFSRLGSISPSGSLAVSGGQGTSLSWTQIHQQSATIGDPDIPVKFIIEVRGSIDMRPTYYGSSMGSLMVTHSITARYL
jgi:hypothetical protein